MKGIQILNLYYLSLVNVLTITIADKNEEIKRQVDCSRLFFKSDDRDNQILDLPTVYVKTNSFEQLNVQCDTKYNVSSLKLYSIRSALIDNDLDLRTFLSNFKFKNGTGEKEIWIKNIQGFNLNGEKFKSTFELGEIVFLDTKFKFYLNNTPIEKNMCTRQNFAKKSSSTMFGSFENLIFQRENLYSTNICPYVVMNTRLKMLSLLEISNSLIYKNQLEFLKINDTLPLNNENLFYFNIHVTYEILSDKILNTHAFANLKVFFATGILYNVENDLFKSFRRLRLILVNIENLKTFYHSGTKWMNSINSDLDIDLNNENDFERYQLRTLTLQMENKVSFFSYSYAYPEDDLCIFEKFPHTKLVFPLLIFSNEVKCTCTILFLIQHYDLYFKKDFSDFSSQIFYSAFQNSLFSSANFSVLECLKNKSLHSLIDSCKYEERLKKCEKISVEKNENVDLFGGDWINYFTFKWTQYIFEVYFKAIFCIIGIVTNTINIAVVKNKNKSIVLKALLYKHILMNSIFNVLFCIISLLSLINDCIFFVTSYCSSIYKYESVQYYKIYGVHFLGNSIRLCCNLSYITICLSRFFLSTSNESNKLAKKFENLNLKKFYILIIFISLLLNLFKVFEFSVNDFYSFNNFNFPFDNYGINFCENTETFTTAFAIKCTLFPILDILNNILNNVLFIFISVVIDVALIRFTSMTVKQKKKIITDEKHLAEALIFKQKINKMIVTNGLVFFLSHMPEFCVTLFVIAFKKKLSYFCLYFFTCTNMIEISQVFSLVSISLVFFIYMKFDKNFKSSFFDLFKTKKRVN
jgi:hypothetical protein